VGRDFKMVRWEPSKEAFDHGQTDYDLDGKHLDLECQTCHTKALIVAEDILIYAQSRETANVLTNTFLGLGTDCADCHADVHHEEFHDQSCQECHSTEGWLKARDDFDHTKETDFSINGAHLEVICEDCHTAVQLSVGEFTVQRFSGLEFDRCTACHEDKHEGAFGQDCLECHTENSFKVTLGPDGFNHNTTRYPLVGEHQQVDCAVCHTQKGQFQLITSFDECSDCHTDYHEGAFNNSEQNPSCEQCHSSKGFLPSLFGLQEHSDTRFPLDGSHLAQPCIFCHEQDDKPIYHWISLECETCHDSAHGDQFSEYLVYGNGCEACHQTSDWSDLRFDHQETEMPLINKHGEISCESCHKATDGVIQYEYLDSSCQSCHEDVHVAQFEGNDCEVCHETSSWNISVFDHTNQSQFLLDGQHADLACGQCHKFEPAISTIRFKPVAHECQDCHNFGDFK
jgi:hypothetical protein